MKSVMVTGMSGFIGQHVYWNLISKVPDYKIFGVTHQANLNHDWEVSDLLDKYQMFDTMDRIRPDYLIHLAWDIGDGYMTNISNIDWMKATIDLVSTFFQLGGTKAVCAGTCFEYDLHKSTMHRTSDPVNPTSLYAACKAGAYHVLNNSIFKYNIVWARIFQAYGEFEKETRLIPTIINGLLGEEMVNLSSSGDTVRDFVYSQDIAKMLIQLVEHKSYSGPINILGDESSRCSIRQLAYTIADLLDTDRNRITFDNSDNISSPRVIIGEDILFGDKVFERTSLIKGLTKTINWWKLQQGKK